MKIIDKLTKKQRLIWIVLFIFIITMAKCLGQNNISIGIFQDAKLATIGDDIGNNAFTLDAKISIALQGQQFKNYFFSVNIEYEYAKIKGGDYSSVLITPNWTFNKIINKLEFSGGPLVGILYRWNESYGTYGTSFKFSYKITSRLKISILGQSIYRADLRWRWNTKGLSYNGYFGIEYKIIKQ